MIKNNKILFLGYNKTETSLIEKIENKGYEVIQRENNIEDLNIDEYSSIISYGYRYILSKKLIDYVNFDIINLHPSYLPWNRGRHSNFWSFYDNTPKGVTIHIIDKGIDTGDIIYQKSVEFSKDENTFAQTYWRLRKELEDLFMENIDSILNRKYTSYPQNGKGTFHKETDLNGFCDWNLHINDFKKESV